MGIEHERCNTQGHHREPEVDDPARPKRERHVEEHDEDAHSEVDRRTREPRVQDAERDSRDREATTSRNVPSATERQVTQDGL